MLCLSLQKHNRMADRSGNHAYSQVVAVAQTYNKKLPLSVIVKVFVERKWLRGFDLEKPN